MIPQGVSVGALAAALAVYGGTDVVRRILGVNRHRAPEGPILSDSVNLYVNPDYPLGLSHQQRAYGSGELGHLAALDHP